MLEAVGDFDGWLPCFALDLDDARGLPVASFALLEPQRLRSWLPIGSITARTASRLAPVLGAGDRLFSRYPPERSCLSRVTASASSPVATVVSGQSGDVSEFENTTVGMSFIGLANGPRRWARTWPSGRRSRRR